MNPLIEAETVYRAVRNEATTMTSWRLRRRYRRLRRRIGATTGTTTQLAEAAALRDAIDGRTRRARS